MAARSAAAMSVWLLALLVVGGQAAELEVKSGVSADESGGNPLAGLWGGAPPPPVLSETAAKTMVDTLGSVLMGGGSLFKSEEEEKEEQKAATPAGPTQAQLVQSQREQMIAAAAAQHQAYLDNLKLQQMRFRARRKRHHKRHKKHKFSKDASKLRFRSKRAKNKHHRTKRHHHHRRHPHRRAFTQHFMPYPSMGSFYQQYYSHPRFQQMYYPNTYGVGGQYNDDVDDEEDDDDYEEQEKEKNEKKEAAKARFEEVQSKAKATEYRSPFNVFKMDGKGQAPHESVAPNSGYGPPSAKAPHIAAEHNVRMGYFGAHPNFLQPPNGAAPQQQGYPRFQQQAPRAPAANNYRFQQTAPAAPAAAGPPQLGNPNPNGKPIPFYPATQAPPPAPNQIPTASALAQGQYPLNIQVASTANMPPGSAATSVAPGANPNAAPMNPKAPGNINSYPFNSFLQMDAEELDESEPVLRGGRVEKMEVEHRIVHPEVYKLATDPWRAHKRTPLLTQHTEPFPLL